MPAAAACAPVDCVVKYLGLRNFFNPSTRFCEPVVVCAPPTQLDAANNSCYQKAVVLPPLMNFTANSTNYIGVDTVLNTTVFIPPQTSGNTTNCSCHNGVQIMSQSYCQCQCNAGWQSATLGQNFAAFVWCTQAVGSNQTAIDPGSASSATAVLAAVATGIALIGLCILFSCLNLVHRCCPWLFCCRRRKPSARAPASVPDPPAPRPAPPIVLRSVSAVHVVRVHDTATDESSVDSFSWDSDGLAGYALPDPAPADNDIIAAPCDARGLLWLMMED